MRLILIGSHTEVDAGTKLFEVDDVALPDAHAGASVEPGGAGDALGVYAEGDFVDIAPVVLGEGVAEEGEPEPAVSPGTAHAHDVDPSFAGERLAEGGAGYLIAVHGQKPEGGIEALLLRHFDEALERAAGPSPHVPKGVLHGLEERTLVLACDEGAHGYVIGPVRLGWNLIEFGLHHVHPAHRSVVERIQ